MVPAPLIWFLLAIALLGAEWLGAEFDGLLAAVLAALTLSVLTALLPGLALAGQLLVFAGATAGLLVALQRWSRRRERAIPASGASEQATVTLSEGGADAAAVVAAISKAGFSVPPQMRLLALGGRRRRGRRLLELTKKQQHGY